MPADPAQPARAPKKGFDLASRTIWVAVGQSMVKAAQVVVALLLVRLLAPAEWSRMALLLSIYAAGYTFGTLNLHQGVVFFFGRVRDEERRGVAVQTIGLLAATGLATALIVLAVSPLLARSAFQLGHATWLVALALLLEIPALATSQFMIACERPALGAAFDAISAVLQMAALCLPPLLGHGIDGAALWLAAYAALRLVAGTLLTFAVVPPGSWKAPPQLVGEQLRYTLPLAFALGMGVLNRSVDKWLVAAIDPLGFGAYAVAAQEVPLVSVVPYAIGAVLATRMVKAFMAGDRERVRGYWLAQTARMSMLVVPTAIALVLIAPEAIVLLFTREYDLAVLPFQIYTVILLHRVAEYGLVLRTAGQTRALWACSAVLLVSNIVCTVPFTFAFGSLGAALGPLLANIISLFYTLHRIRLALHTTWSGVFPWRLYGRIIAVATAAALATDVAMRYLPGADAWPLLARLVVKVAIFAPLCWAAVRALRLPRHLPPVPAD